jgi:hypothetical protein
MTDFRPAWLLIKVFSTADHWRLFDTTRNPKNQSENSLAINLETTESTSGMPIDILSNGFKHRTADVGLNGNQDYIYMAFAENPFAGDSPATAR